MEIKPYQQSLTHSCLAASFLMILETEKNEIFKKKDEQQLTLKGSQRSYPFYVVGITTEVAKKYKVKIHILADNKFFTRTLKKSFRDQNVFVSYKKVTIVLIRKLLEKNKLICHVDTHGLGDYSHTSHFIIIERVSGKIFTIIDPWTGKRKKIAEVTLEKAINELKNKVKMCPLLFLVS